MRQIHIILALALLVLPFLFTTTSQTSVAHADTRPPAPTLSAFTTSP